MRGAMLYDVDHIRVEELPIPTLAPGDVLVKIGASGICTGDVMAWYVRKKAPLVLGHEPAGTIVAVEGEADGFSVGDRVAIHHHAPCFSCRACQRGAYVQCQTWRATRIEPGGIAQYVRVPAQNLRDTLHVPDDVSLVDASLVEPLACVCKSLARSGLSNGDDLLVVGAGVMGLMHALVASAQGANVTLCDVREARRENARSSGFEAVAPEELADRAFDVVICGPGTVEALEVSLRSAGPAATVVMFTPLEPGTRLALDLDAFYFRDIALKASYSCGPDDTRRALSLIASGVVTANKLHATPIALDGVARAYTALARGELIKPIVVFP